MDRVRIFSVRFKNTISIEEIPLFRGAIVNAMESSNLLFHNHVADGVLRYAYPLIQYRRINQKAAIICVGDGADVIGQFFSSCNYDVVLGNRKTRLDVDSVKANYYLIQLWNGEFDYYIRRWLPLNKENYDRYCSEESLASKYTMLEHVLVGNILSFAKGIGIHFENQVKCKITSASEPYVETYKGVKMMAFDAVFKTNVSLPDYIGLGKGVSLGMGTIVRKREK